MSGDVWGCLMIADDGWGCLKMPEMSGDAWGRQRASGMTVHIGAFLEIPLDVWRWLGSLWISGIHGDSEDVWDDCGCLRMSGDVWGCLWMFRMSVDS